MANRLYKQFQGTLEAGVVYLYGSGTTSTSGTLASTTGKGFTITKTAAKTGRYTITLADKYTSLLNCNITIQTSADVAYTASKGIVAMVRNVSVSGSPATLQVQFMTAVATPADTELEDGAKFFVELVLKNSSAY